MLSSISLLQFLNGRAEMLRKVNVLLVSANDNIEGEISTNLGLMRTMLILIVEGWSLILTIGKSIHDMQLY